MSFRIFEESKEEIIRVMKTKLENIYEYIKNERIKRDVKYHFKDKFEKITYGEIIEEYFPNEIKTTHNKVLQELD